MPMAVSDAMQYFQYCVTECLDELIDSCVVVWIDDLLISSTCQEEHVANVLTVLRRLDAVGWKADPRKAVLYSTKVKWCGRVYSKNGVKCDPDRIQGITEM